MTKAAWRAVMSCLALAAPLLNACAEEAEAPTAAITATATISAADTLDDGSSWLGAEQLSGGRPTD